MGHTWRIGIYIKSLFGSVLVWPVFSIWHNSISLKGKENWTKKNNYYWGTSSNWVTQYVVLTGWRQTVTCKRTSIPSRKRRGTPSHFMLYPLPFGIVHGTPHLHRFFVNFGIWAWLVSPLDVVGSSGGVCGADNAWGVSGGVTVVVWLVTEVAAGWVDLRLASAVSSIVLSLPGQAHIRISWAFLPNTILLKKDREVHCIQCTCRHFDCYIFSSKYFFTTV